MPDVSTATTATAAQTQAAGSRMLGYYLGVGGVKVDCLFDTANFLTKNAAGLFNADGNINVRHNPGAGNAAKSIISNSRDGSVETPAYTDLSFAGGSTEAETARIRSYNAFANVNASGLLFSVRNSSGVLTDYANLDGAGNFGVGTVAPAFRLHVLSNGELARFSTTTVRGSGNGYIGLGDATGRKQFIGCGGSNDDFHIMNEVGAAIGFGTNNTFRWTITAAGHFGAATDNTYTMGTSAGRINVVYAGTDTINTSDEREKTWRGAPTKAELNAATRIIGELGFYQWNDAVAEKGDEARYHFGVRAQRVWQIMAEEGLVDPITGTGKDQRPGKTPYAFLCWDEWDEQTEPEMREEIIPAKFEGKGKDRVEVEPERTQRVATGKTLVTRAEGSRFGVRTDQLILFLVAAQEARIAALEAA